MLAIVGLMVLVVTVSPPRSPTRSDSDPPPAAQSGPVDDPDEFDVSATLNADDDSLTPQTIEAVLGDDVEIVVEGRGPASVALGDLEIKPFEQDLPAEFRLLAETTGAYPLVLVDENRQIGTLEIR
ncbi:hypothetical protein OJ997_14070 [Solirubrobacter phytolaccae]|uniref:Uncharacterized protein n=1 Tax=Solirubrobacter phytolaccae TaxID=1404360 RepID=A0A9X3N8K0_9ACTN|nr:hypothetical protein [Solirubrobacter phytolaccae]MDA0181426.1 hypothetical protein [Solirubrobacter phytolaccae]